MHLKEDDKDITKHMKELLLAESSEQKGSENGSNDFMVFEMSAEIPISKSNKFLGA